MDEATYLLFTYPNCLKCGELKSYLAEEALSYEEIDLTRREGRVKIRDFIKNLKRDAKGAVIIPTLVIRDEEKTPVVMNSREELATWLQLKV